MKRTDSLMESRNKILSSINKNLPDSVSLPEIPDFGKDGENLASLFESNISKIGGEVYYVSNFQGILQKLEDKLNDLDKIFTRIPELGNFNTFSPTKLQEWGLLEAGIFHGNIGVAENGAVWVPEENIGIRVLPFICQHLFLIVHADSLKKNMHEAYDHINQEDYGYGVFISGPSKTADIEQSLVIGAHGPLSHTVFIIEKNK